MVEVVVWWWWWRCGDGGGCGDGGVVTYLHLCFSQMYVTYL